MYALIVILMVNQYSRILLTMFTFFQSDLIFNSF